MKQISKEEELRTKLAPPDEANVSMVLNGVGNGMMLGAAPFLMLEMYAGITGKTISPRTHKINAFATVAGCALGGWFGAKEARKIENYRLAVGHEIAKLGEQYDRTHATGNSWAEKVESTPAESTPSR